MNIRLYPRSEVNKISNRLQRARVCTPQPPADSQTAEFDEVVIATRANDWARVPPHIGEAESCVALALYQHHRIPRRRDWHLGSGPCRRLM